ncbi:MAG: phosphonate C-P lyase system protein PhnG, partial [Burkholderiales bacterium]
MFQTVDKAGVGERQRWIGLLARAPAAMLEAGLAAVPGQPHTWLRRPETGLFMVQGRVGGTGNRFNLGEVTVTRCALRLPGGTCGVAYIQGRSHNRAEMAALADALLQV